MNRKLRIGLLLCIAAAMCFVLTGCYIDGDDITGANTTHGSNLPFDTMAPRDTATPSPTPETVTVVTQDVFGLKTEKPTGAIATNDWNWDNTPTPDPASAMNTTITLATATPEPGNTIPVNTQMIPATNPPIATTSSATASPKPTGSLKLGSSGSEVRSVQKRLKELGYLKGSVDGDYGIATQAAVKAFQKANGLTADGKVGKDTLAKLNSKNAKKASATTTKSAKPTVKPTKKATATPKATRTPNLSKDYYLQTGATGAKVRTLQERLIALGWMGGRADGTYGGATEYAVKAYQRKVKGLWADGIAGPDTLKSIYSNSAPKGSMVSSIGYTLQLGSEGSTVYALQRRLKELGYLAGTIDGQFGTGTSAAVIAFQKANGLTADGKAGTGTLNRIYSDKAIKSSGSAINNNKNTSGDSGKDISSTGYKTLEDGSTGKEVKKLQQKLKDLGYYAGSVDGKFGDSTEAAVMAFQQRNHLTVDGKAGPATQRKLYGGNATASKNVTYATLRKGDSGTAVKNLQYTLYELGYYDGDRDGIYGATTQDAVRAFQIANKVTPVDGTAGNKTLQKLYSSSAIAASATSPDYETMRPGDKGESVVELQDCLKQQGYLTDITGVYDDATVAAVKKFQTANGLPADGVAGSKTLVILFGY